MPESVRTRKIAFYGGSFDPVHIGHLSIAEKLVELFSLDEFVFMPAFHAPHKPERRPTSAYHRFAMLCLATQIAPKLKVSTLELNLQEMRYTVDTLAHVQNELPDDEIFFVMGSDSWQDIGTWRDWEKVLMMSNHIVVTRPGYEIGSSHVTENIRERIIDLRGHGHEAAMIPSEKRIYVTDVVNMDISASRIRTRIAEGFHAWRKEVPIEVAKYIEKYQIY